MTAEPTRYRIVCADGSAKPPEYNSFRTAEAADAFAETLDAINDLPCGPHTVEPIAPDPTCAQSSCIHCRDGKPAECKAPPYYTPEAKR